MLVAGRRPTTGEPALIAATFDRACRGAAALHYHRSMRILPFVLIAAACGSDAVNLDGVYRVDSSVESAPCGTDQPVAEPPAYLSFTKRDFLGQDYYAYDECADAAATDCTPGSGLFDGLYEPIDDGWSGTSTASAGDDSDCVLQFREKTAILLESSLVIEDAIYRDQDTTGPCEPEEAESRGRDMPCVFHARIAATKL